MRFSSLFVARPAVAVLSFAFLCGPGSTAMLQAAILSTAPATSLPGVVVEAPKQVARPHRPKQHVVARGTVSPRTSRATPTQSASLTTQSDSPVFARLAKLASATGSCVGGCQSSFSHGSAPWVGCSFSGGTYSPTCRNASNFKTYDECASASAVLGWRSSEYMWYCGSLAYK
jgi:hypothetical protein